jgi:SAM-dependent methyltransferase
MSIYNRPESVEVGPEAYRELFGSDEAARARLFNIGAGQWTHPGWTNLDLPPQSEAYARIQSPCVFHDLVAERELPIPSDTAAALYCSHVVEHLPQDVVQNLMAEAHRCLRPGGVFRIVTGPCADQDWNALWRGDRSWWFWMDQPDFVNTIQGDPAAMTVHDRWLHHLATPRSPYSRTPSDRKFTSDELSRLAGEYREDPRPVLDLLTRGIPFSYKSPGDHISWWNYTKLAECLGAAGFRTITRSAYGQSTTLIMRDMRYFDRTYPQISVYVEGIK